MSAPARSMRDMDVEDYTVLHDARLDLDLLATDVLTSITMLRREGVSRYQDHLLDQLQASAEKAQVKARGSL